MPSPPGNLVFGRRRFLKVLAPADGVLGVPSLLCVPVTCDTTVTVSATGGQPHTQTQQNPTVATVVT